MDMSYIHTNHLESRGISLDRWSHVFVSSRQFRLEETDALNPLAHALHTRRAQRLMETQGNLTPVNKVQSRAEVQVDQWLTVGQIQSIFAL